MAGKCVQCHDREATLRCRQCGKNVCDTCAQKEANGAFCSRECSAKFREYLDKTENAPKPAKGGAGLITKLVGAVIVIILIIVVLVKTGVISKKDVEKIRENPAGALKDATDAAKRAAQQGTEAVQKEAQKLKK